MSKSCLKSGVAHSLLAALLFAAPGVASAAHHRAAQPVSPAFHEQAKVLSRQTVQVMATGTSDAQPGAAMAPVITCPATRTDAAWKDIPEGLKKVAQPGACYARMLIPPKTDTVTEHVIVQAAHTETHTVAEVAQMVEKDVMVQPEHVVHHTIPAVTHTEMAMEVVRPATFREEVIPAQYETRVRHVMVEPEHKEWVKTQGYATGAALVTPGDHMPVRYRADGTLAWPGKDGGAAIVPASNDTADYLQQGSAQTIYCLKIMPAVYRDEQVRVEVAPERTRRVELPAVTREVRRVVVDQPEHVEDEALPPVYEKRRVKEVITPEHTETVEIPAAYHDVPRTRVVDEARPVWREVLCEKNASPAVILQIQKALAAKGYDPGAVDGHLGSKTVSAMQKFEADSNLPQGQISLEAVKALGVDIQHN